MASDINRIAITGRAGRDAEMRYLANGTAMSKFSVACSRWIRGKTPEEKGTEETAWFDVIVWGKLAEEISEVVVKGTRVYVEGRADFNEWAKDDGTKVKMFQIVAEKILPLADVRRGAGGQKPRDEQGWGSGEPTWRSR